MVFFRTAEDMTWVHAWLARETGTRRCDVAPFVMVHSKIGESDENTIDARSDKIRLYLTTNRLLLGVDISGVSVVILVRPPDVMHAILQVS